MSDLLLGNVFSGSVRLNNGTAVLPSLSFLNQPTLGLYAYGTAQMGLVGGSLIIPTAAPASGNYGLLSLGVGPFDGSTSGFFNGNSNGTHIAVNSGSGFAGRMIDLQVAGVRQFAVGRSTQASAAGATLDCIDIPSMTVTITGNTNITTAAGFNYSRIGIPTYSAASALTITNAAALTLLGQPIGAGAGPATITNSYVLWTQSGGIQFDQGTITVQQPVLNMTSTWNSGGVTFTALKLNVTSSAAATASLLMDLQVSSSTRFNISQNGTTTITGSAVSGGVSTFVATPGAHTAVTAEVIDFSHIAHTMTITGGFATERFTNFAQPTISAASGLTVTTAITLNIDGAPSVASSAAITNIFGFQVGGSATIASNTNTTYAAINIPSHTLNSNTTNTTTTTNGISGITIGQITVTANSATAVINNTIGLHVLIPQSGNNVQFNGPRGILLELTATFNQQAAGSSLIGIRVPGNTITLGNTTNLTGTCPIANVSLDGVIIAGAAATVSAAATLYIGSAPSKSGSPTLTATYSFWVNAGISRFDAGVTIGATNSTNNLFSTASTGAGTTAMFIGNAQITAVSDIRLKKDVVNTSINAMDRFRKLRVVDFTWNDPNDQNPYGKNSRGVWTGLIAQETIDHIPWIVNAPDRNCLRCRQGIKCNNHYTSWFVEYDQAFGMVVKGFQEIDNTIIGLQQRISQLENEVNILKEKAA